MDLEYYEISVPDRNDSIMRVNLDEVYYNLRLTWNAYGGFWMLSIRAYGKHYAYATDINGNRQYLEFTRVNDVYLLLSVTVTSSGGLDDDYAARIKSLLMEEILSAGTTIRLQTFIRPIMESVSGVDYVEIRGLLSEKPDIEGVADNSMLTGIVPVEINQQPVLSMSGIRVVKA